MVEIRSIDLSPRVPLFVEATFRQPPRTETARARTQNLGSEGLFLCTPEPLPEQTLLEVSFALGDGEWVQALARVVRVVRDPSPEPSGMALRFEGLAPGTAQLIRRYIDRVTCDGGEPEELPSGAMVLLVDEETDPVCTRDFACFCRAAPAEGDGPTSPQ